MINGHRLIVVTPAGRRRYLSILAHHVLACKEVDEWRLWANTTNEDDLIWMSRIEKRHDKISVQYPSWSYNNCWSIHKYFPSCNDKNSIYVRIDDDIVWMEPTALVQLAKIRIEETNPFLWFGNVINSALTSHLHQRAGRLTRKHGIVHYDCLDPVGWSNGAFAVDLHRSFLANPFTSQWQIQNWELYFYERHSVNVIAWLGIDAAKWAKKMDFDEEQWLSVDKPKIEGRPNKILGSALFSHYAFFPQREAVDGESSIIEGYRQLTTKLA
jgi:hypothetical protein